MKHNFFRFWITGALLINLLAQAPAAPVRAAALPAAPEQTQAALSSPAGLLDPDGSLRLDGSFSGSLDVRGWNVQIDPARGPLFSLVPQTPWSARKDVADGQWGQIGSGSVFNQKVYALAVSGTNVYVGGDFTNANGLGPADYIVKWNGSAWSALGSNGAGDGSLNGTVYAITVSGTSVYVGGVFTNVNNGGTVLGNADYVARLDGSNWSALRGNGAGDGSLNGFVDAITVSGTSVYVGGGFADVNNGGTVLGNADYIARWDGSNWSAIRGNGAGDGSLNGTVYAIAVSGTDVYVGGIFTNVNNGGTVLGNADYITRWNGSSWSSLRGNGAGDGSLSDDVYAIAVSGTDLYVGGAFTDVNDGGTVLGNADHIARWDGSNWSALGSNGAGDGSLNNMVFALAMSGTSVYVGGWFTNVNNGGTVLGNADYIARWDGSNWSALGSNSAGDGSLNDYVYAIAASGTELYVGGSFTDVNNGGTVLGNADYIAKWNASGWSSLWGNGAGDGSLNAFVDALAVSGSNLYVGGAFTNVNNGGTVLGNADCIARWNASGWSVLGGNGAGDGSLNGYVGTLAVSGTDLYVGGGFTNVNNGGTVLGNADYIARWNGSNWSALGGNGAGDGSLNNSVFSITVSGTDLYVGGVFTNVNNGGTVLGNADYIARWDGSHWSALGGNGAGDGSLNDYVYAIAMSGTNVYVGGRFTNVNDGGTVLGNADYVARWDGSNWSSLRGNGAGDGSLNSTFTNVHTLAKSGTDLLVGGQFTSVNNGGTVLPGVAHAAAYGLDSIPPAVQSITRADANPTAAASVHFMVAFSEPVSGVDISDFVLTATGVSGAFITDVHAGLGVYVVTVNTGSGNGSLRLDLIDNDNIIDGDGNPLGGPGLGNGNFTSGEVYTINKTLTFTSAGSQDGWVLESSETSNKGGSLNRTASLGLGDSAARQQYRSILSFATGASLPDTAVITGVTLRLKKQAILGGGNPLNTFLGLMVDVKNGFFGSTAALQAGDFQAAASATLGPFKPVPASGRYSIDLTGASASINKLGTGLTQMRLRFKLDDNNNAVANILRLYSGNAPIVANRPQLVITYYVP